MLTAWKNGFTDTSTGHDLRLPTEDYVGLVQIRHYFNVPVPFGGGLVTRGFKYQLWTGAELVFESEYSLTLQIVQMYQLNVFSVAKELFKTTIASGEQLDPITVMNSQSTSGRIQDYAGKDILPEDAEKLENPSFRHTWQGTRTSEFGTAILDFIGGFDDGNQNIDGRIELPVYNQVITPDTYLDIVTDSMAGAGRADRYQFRFGAPVQVAENIDSGFDVFSGLAMLAEVDAKTVAFSYGPDPLRLQRRALLTNSHDGSLNITKQRHFLVGIFDDSANSYEERISQNGGHTFNKQTHGLIYQGKVSMAQERIIDESTGERGVIAFEGNDLVFRRSGDNWQSPVTIATFDRAELFSLTLQKTGTLYVGNGKSTTDGGKLYTSRDKGASWKDSTAAVITNE